MVGRGLYDLAGGCEHADQLGQVGVRQAIRLGAGDDLIDVKGCCARHQRSRGGGLGRATRIEVRV